MQHIPDSFWQLQEQTPGWNKQLYSESLLLPAPTSVRLNKSKWNKAFPPAQEVPWCNWAFTLSARPLFAADPWWHAGAYYVQEANSMFAGWLVSQLQLPSSAVVLDVCAAPGGKTTHLADVLPPDALLVSNEVIQSRVQILTENCCKWGGATLVSHSDPQHLGALHGMFDLLLVDAPCSGEGLFRREPESVQEWSIDNVQLCVERQQRILSQVWPSLKEGGYLLYSTCTFNTKEDEENIDWLLQKGEAELVDIPVPADWGIEKTGTGTFKFFPWKTKGEGFFACLIRKTSEQASLSYKVKQLPKPRPTDLLHEWVQGPVTLLDWKERTLAIPESHLVHWHLLQQHIRLVRAGIEVATIKGKDHIPSPELALSKYLNKNAFECYAATTSEAIAFLKRELSDIPPERAGWKLLEYEGIPLGFLKKIGNRINNYYPPEWRLRKDFEREEGYWHSWN
ncbi:MAG: rRNA methyltransferase [Cytophagaceae bacterium]|jgi:16S rRNA C967 or C1407 C5-methylase (RsmB/RsmF family)/NOL1/NOP2/fmu family ribosome biogenesis protein|nr:rRNA methyltransferase [Cytophagaceae bacterium]